MQSLHYNNGSIKLTRERATMVSRWEASEVAKWVAGLAGIQPNTGELFLKHNINGAALSLLLRGDLIRMGITKIDQQLILIQSIDLLLTLVNHLSGDTLALLFMRIYCTATTCYNILKRHDEKEISSTIIDNSNVMNSPEFYTAISNLSDAIVVTCHWLGRLPFIEDVKYIDLRRKIIKALVQIRVLLRNLRLVDQINMPKSKLILEINELRTSAISQVRQNKDSLFSSDCYLTRVNLRRPIKDDVNIEYTTMPDFTHVISSIETEALSFMGSGFNAINIGDEIIEINNQVVIGWDPVHFADLLSSSSHLNEICLLVKKMPRHNDDEVYTKRLSDWPPNPRRARNRGTLERLKQQTQENRTMLLEQEGEIEVESDDETLYQSKRSSQIKRDQHSSLPDLTEPIDNGNHTPTSNHIEASSSASSIATPTLPSPVSDKKVNTKRKSDARPQSAGRNSSSPNATPKSPRKTGFESYFSTLFRPRQDPKSVIADMDEHATKDHPQLVNVKRIHSIYTNNNNSTTSLNDENAATIDKSASQSSLPSASSTRSSLSSIFKSSEPADKNRAKRDNGKVMTFRNELKMEIAAILGNGSPPVVTNKPPLNHNDSRKNSVSADRRRPRRMSSYRKISCKDLGKGDCEGFLYRYLPKVTISLVQWRLYWCVLKGGTLYVFKSKDDKNQEVEIKLEGKNVSPAPERRKYGFRIADESNKYREYFYCQTRDEMAKWMNKMGLAAINFNMDDSKIGGFNKGFVDSPEGSPASTPNMNSANTSATKHKRIAQMSSTIDSENDSDKESIASWHKSTSHHSSVSDTESSRDKNTNDSEKRAGLSSAARQARSSSSASLLSLPETNSTSITSASNRFVGQINNTNSSMGSKSHHRTSSSPIRFPPPYEDDQENAYVNAAPRLSDSDSSTEHPYQRMFINTKAPVDNQSQELLRPLINDQTAMLNSSGGFTTPKAVHSSASSDKTPSFSPPLPSPKRSSNSSVFLTGDDYFSSQSSQSTNAGRPSSTSEDASSPLFQTAPYAPLNMPPVPTPIRLPSSTSSSSSSVASLQQHSPALVRTAPLYISVYSSTPPIPLVKGTVSSSAPVPPTNDDELFFTRRSPSPPSSPMKKTVEPSTNSLSPHARSPVSPHQTTQYLLPTTAQRPIIINPQQTRRSPDKPQSPTAVYKYHRFSPPAEQQKP